MPHICMVRSDIPDGILQVLDLLPNTSQHSLIYDPPPQTKYVNRVTSDAVATSGAGPITMSAEYSGLAAYLIDNVEDQDNADAALTAAMANAAAASIIAVLDASGAVTAAIVNGALQAATGGGSTTIDGGDSTGALADVLSILAGASYVLPVGSQVEDGSNDFDPEVSGSFPTTTFRATYDTGALAVSIGEGELATYSDASFVYAESAGAAVVVYADDGTLLS